MSIRAGSVFPGARAPFLDFDRTPIDSAMTRDSMVVPPKLRAILPACIEAFDGAVAIISGRPNSTLDALLDPLRLPAAGVHGLDLRLPDGTVKETPSRTEGLAEGLTERRARLRSLAHEGARLVVEDKGSSLAERKTRWRTLVGGVRQDDLSAWRESCLERLCAVR